MKPAHWVAVYICVYFGCDQAGMVMIALYVGYLILKMPRYLTHGRNKPFLTSDCQGRSGWCEETLDFLECGIFRSLGAPFNDEEQEFQICMDSLSHHRTAT
jgi:hypothetical protein